MKTNPLPLLLFPVVCLLLSGCGDADSVAASDAALLAKDAAEKQAHAEKALAAMIHLRSSIPEGDTAGDSEGMASSLRSYAAEVEGLRLPSEALSFFYFPSIAEQAASGFEARAAVARKYDAHANSAGDMRALRSKLDGFIGVLTQKLN